MAAGAGARPAPRWLRALAEPLSAAQLRRLEEHRYCAAGVSVLEPPLQRYWAWLLRWVPLWLAPNSITLLGLVINLLTTLLLIAYCPTATEEVTGGLRRGGLPVWAAGGPPNCCPGWPCAPPPPPARPRTAGARAAGTPAWLSLPGGGGRRADPAAAPPRRPGCPEAVPPPPRSRPASARSLPPAEGLSRSLPAAPRPVGAAPSERWVT